MIKKHTKVKTKTTLGDKSGRNNAKKKRHPKDYENKKSFNGLLIVALFTGVLLIVSTYAWLSASLNVKIKFFDLSVATDKGLFISLDGIDYSDTVEISANSVISDLKATYPNHTNQWAVGGLWPVSSNGIKTPNNNKFDVYSGEVVRYKDRKRNSRKFLDTKLISEDKPESLSGYIAFDIFLKNVSGSPNNDNLYLDEGTMADFEDDVDPEIKDSMTNIINSMRFGFVKIGSVSSKSDVSTIQNISCNNNCEMVIYEPNNTSHSTVSISKANQYGITIVDGVNTPTYAVINEGNYLEHTNGQIGSGIPLDTEHFALQNTIKNFSESIFEIPNGVTKFRVYVWIEGQDIDSLETSSKGAACYLAINFVKDLAGYE